MKRVYDHDVLSFDQDPVSSGYIVDPELFDRIVDDANRYQLLKSADRGEVHWVGGENYGWLDFDFDTNWDEKIDNAFD